MKAYKTLRGETLDLDQLSPKEKVVYWRLKDFCDTNPEWPELRKLWLAETKKRGVFKGIECPVTNEPLFKICSDLETRLCLKRQEENNESQKPKNNQKPRR